MANQPFTKLHRNIKPKNHKMLGKMSKNIFVFVMVLCMLMATLHARKIDDDISCSAESIPAVFMALYQCLPFLEGSPPATPSSDCCVGATSLFQKANTTYSRRYICQCIKNIVSAGVPLVSERAKQFPQLCHISEQVPIDPKIDCNS